jgi:hypothetical protein
VRRRSDHTTGLTHRYAAAWPTHGFTTTVSTSRHPRHAGCASRETCRQGSVEMLMRQIVGFDGEIAMSWRWQFSHPRR